MAIAVNMIPMSMLRDRVFSRWRTSPCPAGSWARSRRRSAGRGTAKGAARPAIPAEFLAST